MPLHCLTLFPFLPPPCSSSSPAMKHSNAGRREMSSSSSASRPSWPQYGLVPLTRCPDCPRKEPLKRLTCVKEDHGNRGREFIKCESRP
uniref:Zinc finger GRF-type domain-containing protein n=2 Tax=Aegilops tauschii subsp. strangulata TaxID=200361 RepID=A0A453JZD1_AEGTS